MSRCRPSLRVADAVVVRCAQTRDTGVWPCFVRALHIVAMVGAMLSIATVAHAQSTVDALNPGANLFGVYGMAEQADGKILVGGHFSMLGGGGSGTTPRSMIGRLNVDGTLDMNFNPGANNWVRALAVQPDGKILVGGAFNFLGGGTGTTPRHMIGRLNADGTLDTSFNHGAAQDYNNDGIYALALQADGKILVGGDFTTMGGAIGTAPRHRIARLNANGSLDTSFNPGAGGVFVPGDPRVVLAVVVQADGKILVGGHFTMLGGGGDGTTPRYNIGRLHADGTLDTSFDPGANSYAVRTLAVQADGKILVGGDFSTLGGGGTGTTARNAIGRLNADGSLDTSFNPGRYVPYNVHALAVRADGKILVGGFGGANDDDPDRRRNLGRLNADGTLDTSFNVNASGTVNTLMVQADGKVLVAGSFSTLGGLPRRTIGRLTATDIFATAPAISTQPQSQTIATGQTATLSVVATGTAPNYQWYLSSSGETTSPISGETSRIYTTPALTSTTGYWVRVSNGAGTVDSSVATVTVVAVPTISTQPTSQTIGPGQTATLSVVATGPGLSYQWYVGTSGTTTSPISGAQSTHYTTPVLTGTTSYWVRVSNTDGTVNSSTAIVTVPTVSALPASLRFGATKAGAAGALTSQTAAQDVTVSFIGASPSWTATTTTAWLQITNGSGTGTGRFRVAVINPSNTIGGSTSRAGTVTLTSSGAGNSPLSVPVTLTVDQTGSSTVAAFGQVDTPVQGATGVQGAIGVTGWLVDDVGVSGVKIYRNCLSFENQASCQVVGGVSVVFIGDAAFVAGARPDVEAAYSTYPATNVAGWGYLLLTNMLPHVTGQLGFGGQGSLNLYVFATDLDGHVTLLGRTESDHTPTSITMTNASIAKPFGAIDTPSQGGTVSGAFANFGWVLTPDSNTTADGTDILMATNGSAIRVFIDGVSIGNVTYNQCRGNVGNPVPAGQYCNDDVANIFGNATPQPVFTMRTANATLYRNLDAGRAAIGSFDIPSGMTNGSHSIAWGVTDSAGRSEGIGSRNFFVLNTGADAPVGGDPPSPLQIAASADRLRNAGALSRGEAVILDDLPRADGPVWGRSGFSLATPFAEVVPNAAGERHVQIDQMGRLELQLGAGVDKGYLVANGTLRDLPAGSHLDVATGTFTWAPAPGYLGAYRLVFVARSGMEAGSLDPAKPSASAGSKDPASIRIDVTIRAPRNTPAGEPEIRMHVDTPAADAVVSGRLTIAGWSLDPHSFTGSGIGAVHVWARRLDVPTLGPAFVGAATLGGARPDVAAAFGAAHHAAGFGLTASLAPGLYEITTYAWNERTARWEDARTVQVTVR